MPCSAQTVCKLCLMRPTTSEQQVICIEYSAASCKAKAHAVDLLRFRSLVRLAFTMLCQSDRKVAAEGRGWRHNKFPPGPRCALDSWNPSPTQPHPSIPLLDVGVASGSHQAARCSTEGPGRGLESTVSTKGSTQGSTKGPLSNFGV